MDENEIELTPTQIGAMIGAAAAATAAACAAGLAIEALLSATATDIVETDITGTRAMNPTSNNADLQRSDNNGVRNTNAGANDVVSGQKGDVEGNSTVAAAAVQEAEASETGASALITSAGATEIATKAMKMN